MSDPQSNPVRSIIEYVRGERGWVSIHFLACDLERLGRAAPEAWEPICYDHWRSAIEGCIASGMLRSNGNEVALPLPKATGKKNTQGRLFPDEK